MKLIYTNPSWVTDGIFRRMTWAPWIGDPNVSITALDMDYYGNHSGEKELSPLLDKMTATAAGHILTDVQWTALSEIIRSRYNDRWSKVWNALQTNYSPLENYDLFEGETSSGSDSRDRDGRTGVGTDMQTVNTGKSKNHIDSSSTAAVKPFSTSGEWAEINKTDGDTESSSAMSDNETRTTTSGSAEDNYQETTETETGTHASSRDLRRHGNIGVTTSQQMLQSEVELRSRVDFFRWIYECLDEVLTINYWR